MKESRKYRAPWADKATKLSETVGEVAGHRAVTDRFDGTKWLKYDEVVKGEDGKERTVTRETKLPELAPDTPGNPNPIPVPDSAPNSGVDQFDMIYRTKDDGYVIVEAKSNQETELGHRTLNENGAKRRIKQGTGEYFRNILNGMLSRPGEEAKLAKDIMKKQKKGLVHYVEARGDHVGGYYYGESLRFFDVRGN